MFLVIFLVPWSGPEWVRSVVPTNDIFITKGVPDFDESRKISLISLMLSRGAVLSPLFQASLFALSLQVVGVARLCDPHIKLPAIKPILLSLP